MLFLPGFYLTDSWYGNNFSFFLRGGGSGLVQFKFETRKLGNLEKPETFFRVGEREGRKEGRNNGWMEGTYGQRAWTDARNGRKDRTDGDMG